MANRMDILDQLAAKAPEMDQQAQASGQAARMSLLAKQLGNPQVQNLQQAQDLSNQNQAQAGQQRVEQLKQQQQIDSGLGTLAIQKQNQAGENNLQQQALTQQGQQQTEKQLLAQRLQNETIESKKRTITADQQASSRIQQAGMDYDSGIQFATQRQREDLAKLGNGIKESLIDSRLAFDKDERGRAFSNERQLADFAVSSAQSQQELQAKLQKIAFESDQKDVAMSAVRDRMLQMQKQGFIEREGDLDRQQQIRLVQLRAAADREAQRKRATAANRMSASQAIFTIGGAVVGGVIGSAAGPVGTAAGATAGAAVGGAVGSVAASSTQGMNI